MALPLKIDVLPEPQVEFANASRDVDPRRGLAAYGPADNRGLRTIRLGLVGLADDIEATRHWINRFQQFMPAFEGNSNRFRNWPGLKEALNCTFVIEDQFVRPIEVGIYNTLFKDAVTGRSFNELVELFDGRINSLFGDEAPDCVVVCIKPELGDLRVANPGLTPEERKALEVLRAEEESDQLALFQPSEEEKKAAQELYTVADDLLFRTFYRAIKARAMMHDEAVPIQILRRDTIDRPDDKGQSNATRSWNFATSLYYKAKGIPWRPTDLPKNVCFVGISFHHMKKRSGHLVYASVAQAYSTDVEPFALKGAHIDHDKKHDRQPYLNEAQASGLLEDVLNQYFGRAGVMPDRVVVHKTTGFAPQEIEGFKKAAKNRVSTVDYVWLRPTSFRIVRKGLEDPWRGTLCSLTDQSYLFTSGYVPWWNEYPGMHIPAPLELGSATATNMKDRAQEILTLTKMNWNSSDGIARLPITLLFARRVGELMEELSDNATPKASYRFYI
ncbi:hypothetical protein QCM77_09285 [Bradyrhizobium sp. SSUT18]|uniref:argonaute/piwi family protein n=1 Tax=Bradyrhizobium sp. SSUT18 TaxID=3040602 RepID=UPI00244AED82|nr:hypothetical protein [Bradyrhizobium sp. SSUT18]MDH2400139.1 hypothetical protein [Bradyrhizobium sp. SSUT18]